MFRNFESSAATIIATISKGGEEWKSIPIGTAGGISDELEKLIDNASGLGFRAHELLQVLRVTSDALVKTIDEVLIQANPDKDPEDLKQLRSRIGRVHKLRQHQTYIDVTRAEPNDRLPTLLSCNVEDLRFLEREHERCDLVEAWQQIKQEVRSFAIRLMEDSPEAKSALQAQPEKLEWLGLSR